MNLAVEEKEELDFHNLEWLMSSVEIESVLHRLNVKMISKKPKNDQLWGFCPDHEIYTGKLPSHAKWSINVVNGQTFCFTEGRGSNILWIVSRVKGLNPYESVEWILGDSIENTSIRLIRLKKSLLGFVPNKEVSSLDLNNFKKQLSEADIGNKTMSFLLEKNISLQTAERFGCREFGTGFYKDRMIFPVYSIENDLVGFIATSIYNEKKWLEVNDKIVDNYNNYRKTTREDFRKVRYPSGFSISDYLIGSNLYQGKTAILVEGCRDVMKLHQEGFKGALGLGGSNISEKQVEQLSKLNPSKIIIMLDGDKAGHLGSKKVFEKCSYFFDNIYITTLDLGVDPKDLSRSEIRYYLKHKTEKINKK